MDSREDEKNLEKRCENETGERVDVARLLELTRIAMELSIDVTREHEADLERLSTSKDLLILQLTKHRDEALKQGDEAFNLINETKRLAQEERKRQLKEYETWIIELHAPTPSEMADEIRRTWATVREVNGQTEAFRILERMVDRLGYGRYENNPSLAKRDAR